MGTGSREKYGKDNDSDVSAFLTDDFHLVAISATDLDVEFLKRFPRLVHENVLILNGRKPKTTRLPASLFVGYEAELRFHESSHFGRIALGVFVYTC